MAAQAAMTPAAATETTVGMGSFSFRGGSKYDGEYLKQNGQLMRQGKGRSINGPEEYLGEWEADKMHGKGVYLFASGARYEGEFKNNCFDGYGEYRWPDGATYVGTWKDNKMHGNGIYTSTDGVKWKGAFYNGRYNNGKTFVSLR